MPNMARFIDEGVIGNLATLYPELSPMLWTSIATGKRPFKHGILGFTEPSPDGEGLRPITNISRKTKAIWNILSQSGKKCNVVSWWPSHPAASSLSSVAFIRSSGVSSLSRECVIRKFLEMERDIVAG
jgi:predicted AlkP superfamily phosphohydrolase/phosphomutase